MLSTAVTARQDHGRQPVEAMPVDKGLDTRPKHTAYFFRVQIWIAIGDRDHATGSSSYHML
jgi:hypothetical protein